MQGCRGVTYDRERQLVPPLSQLTNSLAKCGDSGGLKWAVGPFDDIICVRRAYRLQNCAVELLEGFMAARPI